MSQLDDFIQQARQKNIDEADIREALEKQGWSTAEIKLGLAGLKVPTRPTAAAAAKNTSVPAVSLSPVMAAIHHVLLWFFSIAAAIAISGLVASLYGTHVSTEALASMIAVAAITFTPYAVLYVIYLRGAWKNWQMVPGKVWSIITICLYSVGAMAAALSLVVMLITDAGQSTTVTAALILTLYLLILVTYIFAAFFVHRPSRLRRIVITTYLPALALLLGSLVVISILQLGPARADEQLRKDMVTAVDSVRNYTTTHQQLPNDADQLSLPGSITYSPTGKTTYKVCATFHTDNTRASSYQRQIDEDSYAYESMFYGDSGYHCFEFRSSTLSRPSWPSLDTQNSL